MFARQHARHLLSEGNTCVHVVYLLRNKGIITTCQTVWRLKRHIRAHKCIEPLPKSRRSTKLSDADLYAIDAAMECDDKTTGKEIVALLERNGLSVSKRMVYRARRKLGWTSRELHTANLFARHIVWNAFSGLGKIWAQLSSTLSGWMRQPCSWRPTTGSAAARKGESPGTNLGQSTQ